MKVLKSTRSVWFDVDDTLVIWDWKSIDPEGKGLIYVSDPGGQCVEAVMPHKRHIELMRQFKARGHQIFVWSQGGHEWAEAVCRALEIEDIVDFVLDKPNWYVDDLPASAWMKSPIYLDPLNPEKDSRWGISHVGDVSNEDS